MIGLFRLTVLFLLATSAVAQVTSSPSGGMAQGSTVVTQAPAMPSSMRALENARDLVAKNPKDPGANAALGFALCHRAEVTFDSTFYANADEALKTALQLSPDNFEALKAQVCVKLGRHEFADARKLAMVLNKRIPDDIMVYGLLVDANAALGNYPEAENAAQWMLNLRPGNTPAFVHAADLREVFGEQQGAIQLLRLVLDATPPTDTEARVRVMTQMARVNLEMGNIPAVESMLEQALSVEPNNSCALLVLSQARLLQGRSSDAVQLLKQSYSGAPRTETLYSLAEAMEAAGMRDDAEATFAKFEREAIAESADLDNANRDLVFFYADHADNTVKALQIAEQEMAMRHDVYTLDAYAWALYKNGRYIEAMKQMDIALKVGVREAPIFYRSAEIELRLNNIPQAESYLRLAAEMNSIHSQDARIALAKLQPLSATTH